MKSPPSRGSDAPHVHPRLRKRPQRCTLDCGFETSESPALRGFVAERCPITGTALYLVLKSNGLRHSKNLPVKFGFSPKTVPAYIVKKLPPQRCSKPFLIAFFNFSHKRPTFAFAGESGYTPGFAQRIAHKRSHGETRGVSDGGCCLYPRAVLRGSETLRGRVSERQTLPLLGLGRVCSRRTQRACGTVMHLCASLFRGVAPPLGCVIFSVSVEIAACMPCAQGLSVCARLGWYHYPRRALRVAETLDGRLSKGFICRFLRFGSLH